MKKNLRRRPGVDARVILTTRCFMVKFKLIKSLASMQVPACRFMLDFSPSFFMLLFVGWVIGFAKRGQAGRQAPLGRESNGSQGNGVHYLAIENSTCFTYYFNKFIQSERRRESD